MSRHLWPLALLIACNGNTKDSTPQDTSVAQDDDYDRDGFYGDEDCDDHAASTHPGATEICDGVDNDCDDQIDEGVEQTWYADEDGDGFGDLESTLLACTRPDDASAIGTDCDDTDEDNYPGAPERCDGVDNDCDGEADEDLDGVWYADEDGDGYGDPDASTQGCEGGDDLVDVAGDCDDGRADVNPDAEEVCDGVDDDCDGQTDEADATDPTTWYQDRDEDGYGDPDRATAACDAPSGYVGDDGDCDDLDPAVNPDAVEVCDGVDDDCDGVADDGATDAEIWYADADDDGYGDAATTAESCEEPDGYASNDRDCDDSDDGAHPGAPEHCDGVDNDCDGEIDEGSALDAGTWYADDDADGYGDPSTATATCEAPTGWVADDGDCDDADEDVNPGATERCDGIDDDCDDQIDEDSASDASTWYADRDGDGYGDATTSAESCSAPDEYVADDTDCDDRDRNTFPGADEVCDGADNDCDDQIDEGTPVDADTWYADGDGDGYGTPDASVQACDEPVGYSADDSDCDDDDKDINPGATELCDGTDQDCDGDEDGVVTYTNTTGAQTDVTSTWAAGTSTSPASITLSTAGSYSVCPGTWYVSLTSSGPGMVVDGRYGSGETTLSGGGSKRTVYTTKALSLNGLTLADGDAGTGNGGNLYSSSTLTLEDVVLSDGVATRGGNLDCAACTLDLSDVEISGGDADYGGGLYASSATITGDGVTFSGNDADYGGGIYSTASTGTYANTTISGGYATQYGGGVYLASASSMTMTGSEIADNSSANGGGAYLSSSTLSISSGSNVDGNAASLLGGGMYIAASATFDCTGSSSTTAGVWGNTALAGGGAYVAATTGTINSTTCDWTAGSDNSLYDIVLTIYYFNYNNNASFTCTGYSCS